MGRELSYAHIHVHSEFSQLDGLSTCKEIAHRAKELGCTAAGLSDHGVVAGHLEFTKACQEAGVKPVYAMEAYHGRYPSDYKWERNQRDQAHLLLGALDSQGLKNLWRLSSLSARNFRFVGRVSWEMLEEHNEGLFCTSACIQSLVSQEIRQEKYDALEKYLSIFGNRFYIELHTYPSELQREINEALVQVAQEKGLPVIFACDAHFASGDQYLAHDSYLAMQTGETLDVPPEQRKMWHPKSLYMQEQEEVNQNLSYLPTRIIAEALDNSGALAEQCNAELPQVRRHLPIFKASECPWLDEDKSAKEVLLDLVHKGIIEKYADPEPAFAQAIEEFNVFSEAGLEHYLLMTWDLVQFCKHEDITIGPGRGSGASSVLNYALGITMLDPLKYNLYFERFYNAGREKGFPDIDLDFPKAQRERVRQYLIQRWGENRVRNIGNVNRMKPKKALDQTYKVCGVTYEECETVKRMVTETVPDLEILGTTHFGWSKEYEPGKEAYVLDFISKKLERWITEQPPERHQRLRDWLDLVAKTSGRVFTYGVHASGVVISDVDLDDELPCTLRGSEDKQKVLATQFPMVDVERLMFVKEDILGLRNLDTLDEWETLIGFDLDWDEIDEAQCHEEMWELFDKGLTLGVFQIEGSTTAKDLCQELQPRSIYDLGVIVALNRPGPLRSGAARSYILRKQGIEKVTYDHPLLEPLLKDTYGVIVFQEQIIRLFEALGYTKQQADQVRAILGKKKPKDMAALLEGTGKWEGISYTEMAAPLGKAANVVWNKLLDYTKYSFNAPHALSYGVLTFRTAFAKYYGTQEFLIACMRTNPDEAGLYVAEARRMGIDVLPPDISSSGIETSRVGGDIVFGLSNVKWVGKSTAKRIIEWRQKYDISSPEKLTQAVEAEQEIWAKDKRGVSPRTVCKKSIIEHLTNAGAFDAYEPRKLSTAKRQEYEEQYLGVILSDDSEKLFEKYLTLETNPEKILLSYEEAQEREKSIIPGVVTDIRKTRTKYDQDMAMLTLRYNLAEMRIAIFPDLWQKYGPRLSKNSLGFFQVKKGKRGHSLLAAKILS